ncbi:nectin-3-like [Mustelus asterias]
MASMVWNSVTILALLCVAASDQVTGVTLTAFAGARVLLPCRGTGYNTTLVYVAWKKETEENDIAVYSPRNGTSIPNPQYSSRMVFRNNSPLDGSILLNSLQMQDEGMYICELSLFAQRIQRKTMNLTVVDPPEVTITRYDGKEGVILRCVAEANPPATTYSWRGLPGVKTSTRTVFVEDGSNGNVSCLVTNSIGTGKDTIEIIFKDSIEGHAIGKTIILSVAVGVLLLVVLATILIVLLIRRKRKAAAETYVNSSFQRHRIEQDSPQLPGSYMLR